ncbi:hypothetical protein, partial [Methylobacterium indicum]|uniref:hypothetical protein n=1 Tax=Methylobacterium indicum TaxID=1775910 RepID=UPI001AD9149E
RRDAEAARLSARARTRDGAAIPQRQPPHARRRRGNWEELAMGFQNTAARQARKDAQTGKSSRIPAFNNRINIFFMIDDPTS